MNRMHFSLISVTILLIITTLACGISGSANNPAPTFSPPTPQPELAALPKPTQPLPSVITDEDQVLIELYNPCQPSCRKPHYLC